MIALGRLATAPSCLSKLLLRPYTVAQMPLRRRLSPSLTLLFPYAEPRQESASSNRRVSLRDRLYL